MSQEISFRTNNGGRLSIFQADHDSPVLVSGSSEMIIPAADMVQLLNLYKYTMRYDIRDSFINPRGRYVFADGTLAPSPNADPPAGPEEKPLPVWYFLAQDGDGGYHIYRRPVDEFNPDPARQEDVNDVVSRLDKSFRAAYGGAVLASWVESQLVEVADLADIQMD